MTALSEPRAGHGRIVALVSIGHAYSHFSTLILPPLFPAIKAALGLSYIELGALVAAFGIATSAAQVPVGFLVDRIGGRAVLLAGLALLGGGLAAIGLVDSYGAMMALAILAGLGNSVFHPADYSIMAARVAQSHLGRAMSVHAFSGYLGWAIAPPTVLFLSAVVGWQMAIVIAGLAGIVIAAGLAAQGSVLNDRAIEEAEGGLATEPDGSAKRGADLMRSLPMVMMFLFFLLTSVAIGGVTSFAVVALGAVHGLGAEIAGYGLTAFLASMALGVLAGGWLGDATTRHNLVASLAVALAAVLLGLLAYGPITAIAVIAIMIVAGAAYGVSSPSRDLLVKALAPPGTIGVAFGFTSTGLGAGMAIGPVVCGWMMDHGQPAAVFLVIAAFSAIAVASVVLTRVKARESATAA